MGGDSTAVDANAAKSEMGAQASELYGSRDSTVLRLVCVWDGSILASILQALALVNAK